LGARDEGIVTAKVEAVIPNPSPLHKLVEFLRAYRDWTQHVIDQIWYDRKIPSMRELHYRFYRILRQQGFRAPIVIRLSVELERLLKQSRRTM